MIKIPLNRFQLLGIFYLPSGVRRNSLFHFSVVFLSSLICLLTTDKILYAYQPIGLETIVVTPSRADQYPSRIPGNVTVISRQQIEEMTAQNIADVLKTALGVSIYDNSSVQSSVADIRGFGDTAARNVLILVDGRRINSIDISGPDLSQIPVEVIDRIEIIRGAGSVLYGDNAVGGVINIITKKGAGKLSGRAGTTAGSYGQRRTDLEIKGSKKAIDYLFYSQYEDSSGYRANSSTLARDFHARLDYASSENLTSHVSGGWHAGNQGLPGGLSASELETFGRRGTSNPDDFTTIKDRYIDLSFDLLPDPVERKTGHWTLDVNYRNRDVYDAFYRYGEFSTKRNIDTIGGGLKYVLDRNIDSHRVNLISGVDYYDTTNDILGSGTNVDDITIAKKELGVFGYGQYELVNDVYVNAGTRYDQAQYNFDQRNVPVNQSQRPDEWVSMAGMVYEYARGSNLHAQVQQTFRFLATDEWYSTANFPGFGITPGLNLNLEQQHGIQYEIGIKHNFHDTIAFDATPYWIDTRKEIFFDPVTFANSNYGRTNRAGVEIGSRIDLLKFVAWRPVSQMDLRTTYQWERPVFQDGVYDGKIIPFVARHQANAGFNVEFLRKYRMNVTGRYVGSRYAINDTLNETPRVKPQYVLDTKFAYHQSNWELYVAINNICNERYFSFVSKSTVSTDKSYFPAPGRNFGFGADVKF